MINEKRFPDVNFHQPDEDEVLTAEVLATSGPSNAWEERIQRLEEAVSRLSSTQPPSGYVPFSVPITPDYSEHLLAEYASPLPSDQGKRWYHLPIIHDLKELAQMYFDPRYRLSRLCQLGAPAIFALMVLNYLFFAWWNITFMAPLLERIFNLLLALVLFHIWYRELKRYQNVLAYLTMLRRDP